MFGDGRYIGVYQQEAVESARFRTLERHYQLGRQTLPLSVAPCPNFGAPPVLVVWHVTARCLARSVLIGGANLNLQYVRL